MSRLDIRLEKKQCYEKLPYSHCNLLTLPYLACQAKKYNSAANGCPTRQKLTQNIQLPVTFPFVPCILSRGKVPLIRGI